MDFDTGKLVHKEESRPRWAGFLFVRGANNDSGVLQFNRSFGMAM
jgi:hypothetical protein